MKNTLLKSLILTLIISIVPAPVRAMEGPLTAESIIHHPNFIILKQRLEEAEGSITIYPDRISIAMQYKSGENAMSVSFNHSHFWYEAEFFFQHLFAFKTHAWELEKTLPDTLQGLCILNIGHRYSDEDPRAIEQTEQLPEDLKHLVLKIARKIS